jgi:dephospho-CoA kinase
MLKVGLTGGIACGKSYSLKEFEKLGVHPIDADKIAHRLIEPGQPGYDPVVAAFGREFLDSDQRINRKMLGKLVFADDQARARLNTILHPLVFAEEQRLQTALQYELSNVRPQVSMTDAALMIETGRYSQYDVLIVVYCRSEIQLCRLMFRDQIPEEQARRRVAIQMPLLEKVKYADYVIDNSGKLSDTRQQIHHIFADLRTRFEL